MKTLFALTVAVCLVLLCGACGGTGATQPKQAAVTTIHRPFVYTSSHPDLSSLKVDEDDDDTAADLRASSPLAKGDNDADFDNDYKWRGGYYDGDDAAAATFGHAADAAQKPTLLALADRYYTAAATTDGATACSMLTSAFAASVVEDYGHGSAGPLYLKAARSCAEVMTLMFRHAAPELTAPLEVIAVRVGGSEALVLVGSKVFPARQMIAQREGGGWRVATLLGLTLP